MFVPRLPASLPVKPLPGKKAPYPARLYRCEELSERLPAYIFRKRLGGGAFGQVFLAEFLSPSNQKKSYDKRGNVRRSQLVAVKIVPRARVVKESTRALALAEANNLKCLSETGSLFFAQLRETFCDTHNLYIVTDYLCGGTLRDELIRHRTTGRPIPNDRIVLIIAQLVEALRQLRKLRILHRDIKPENVLLDACGNVVLADFGLSRRFENDLEDARGDSGENGMTCKSKLNVLRLQCEDTEDGARGAETSCLTNKGCGTLPYASPEMHRGELYSFATDIYSLGVVFHELLFDDLPPSPPSSASITSTSAPTWFFNDHQRQRNKILINPIALDLLAALLHLDPNKRITFPALPAHAFFVKVHWPTLAAHAYILPVSYAPPRPPLNLYLADTINAGLFVDPFVTLQDGPDGAFEEAYKACGMREMKERPQDPIRWRSGVRRGILSTLGRVMCTLDTVVGLEGRVRSRKWISGFECKNQETFVWNDVPMDLNYSPPVHEPKDNVEIRVHVEEEKCDVQKSVHLHCDSVTANLGHYSSPHMHVPHPLLLSPSISSPARPRLRRIVARIPERSSRTPHPSPRSCQAELCSTAAVHSSSAVCLGGEVPHLSRKTKTSRPSPWLPRLTTKALPLSSPDPEPASSTSFLDPPDPSFHSRYGMSNASGEGDMLMETHPLLQPAPSCSIVGPQSLTLSRASTNSTEGPITPVRGDSVGPVLALHLPDDKIECSGGADDIVIASVKVHRLSFNLSRTAAMFGDGV
ncbi:kinase-like protein [Fomitiporia mediterranea MF3/22]|uniref:kinase-like protein n=1 Tax=Fomitiporia mediterranea (strain MF3/22) TaxID=694068 RepID=UPI0004408C30|nr:kinase-like protein [Fomitiporia mediterranea MF3/22]EJD07736.1 kinase-like protein [Fomitiporia mediterranea MF3/22]